ncbi:YolD-like family protein [Bacillus mesophilum]|uniref:YolD-like family protein n=1 Tax=Bacillus mesophilum TaxID=1071718 RepID=A0A7V7RMX9_9BACI|nr:YolD-like family protein [Bacillus mesophilum]KAB2333765.1 YolD-like family protein [Bacillus mesophilum]
MIRDRGRIKWTAMMLPEHVKMLRDWAAEDQYEQKKELDEQEVERLNEVLAEAMEFNRNVVITHYRRQKYELTMGTIHFWDEMNKRLHIVDRFHEIHRIDLSSVVDVRLADD